MKKQQKIKNNFVDRDTSKTSFEIVSVLFSKLKSFVSSLLPIWTARLFDAHPNKYSMFSIVAWLSLQEFFNFNWYFLFYPVFTIPLNIGMA